MAVLMNGPDKFLRPVTEGCFFDCEPTDDLRNADYIVFGRMSHFFLPGGQVKSHLICSCDFAHPNQEKIIKNCGFVKQPDLCEVTGYKLKELP